MSIAILATGDEIVHGDTLNTNSQYIAKALSSDGIPLGLHMSCSDKETEMVGCLNYLKQQHDCIIIIGGLGPTSDDRTRYALASSIQQPLMKYPEAVRHLEDRLNPGNIVLSAGNLQQALFPAKAELLPNPYGSAVGCYGLWQDTLFVLLPGPPKECLPMFDTHVLPLLQKKQHSSKQILKWLLFGFAESEIAELLDKSLADLDCQTGYRLDIPYVEFKVRCKPALAAEVKKRIEPIIQDNLICPANKKASTVLKEKIGNIHQSLTIIDEVTGGKLQTLIHCPDNDSQLSFHDSDASDMTFHLSGLKAYWQQAPKGGESEVLIHFKSNETEGSESIMLPYRSNHIIDHAAEWLCFRMSHFIDKLHQ